MEIRSANEFGGPTREGLQRFLIEARRKAERLDRPVLASITLRVAYIDPLAVLASIYEADELHLYLERQAREEAVATAEATFRLESAGAGRFRCIRDALVEIFDDALAAGDLDVPGGGPHACLAGTFEDEAPPECRFAALTAFIPRWQVTRRGSHYAAVANARVVPGTDPGPDAERIWRAHQRFQSFDYPAEPERPTPGPAGGAFFTQKDATPDYRQRVAKAVEAIHAGQFGKIVLARRVDLVAPRPFSPIASLDQLRRSFPGCTAFSFSNDSRASFIGATPESLLRIEGGTLQTEAIAGSAARGTSPQEDARRAGALLASRKDLAEHRFVLDSIVRRLAEIGIDARGESRPGLLQLRNVQHLRTPIKAPMPPDVHLLDAVRALHPTPAVGGTPRDAALAALPSLEGFARGLFAGTIGMVDWRGDGEVFVGIRSALLEGCRASIYAGAGIVAESNPEREWQETHLKLQAILEHLS